MSMFKHHEMILREAGKDSPERLGATAIDLYKDAQNRLLKASPYELAAELREPSSPLVAVRDATTNEALARMLLAWTT